jgi:hypothetical protein
MLVLVDDVRRKLAPDDLAKIVVNAGLPLVYAND